jgi:hypothetical protein
MVALYHELQHTPNENTYFFKIHALCGGSFVVPLLPPVPGDGKEYVK